MADSDNFASIILAQARAHAQRKALVIPKKWEQGKVVEEENITFGQFVDRVESLARGLKEKGFLPDQRAVVLFPLSIDLYALTMALLLNGMALVLIDTGMGHKKLLKCINFAKPDLMVSIHALLKFWPILPALWPIKGKYAVDKKFFGIQPFSKLYQKSGQKVEILSRHPDDEALITFTSGSTGMPKGVNRTHALLTAQHLALKEHFPYNPQEVNMTCFPVVALHNLCCGVPTVFPPVDLKAPAAIDPATFLNQVERHQVTSLSCAPAFISKITAFLLQPGAASKSADHINTIVVGGAPVSRELCQNILTSFPKAQSQVAYGSSEAEPIASNPMEEVAVEPGPGFLVGRPAACVKVVLLNIPPGEMPEGKGEIEPFLVKDEQEGEIVVSGPHVNQRYVNNPQAEAKNKIFTPQGTVWHRTGDVGRFDQKGRLWIMGRRADTIFINKRLIHPIMVEAAINEIPGVKASALIDNGHHCSGRLVLQLETNADWKKVKKDVIEGLKVMGLPEIPVGQIEHIPVDSRHNSKIDRITLRKKVS